jgi:hypothetical protein
MADPFPCLDAGASTACGAEMKIRVEENLCCAVVPVMAFWGENHAQLSYGFDRARNGRAYAFRVAIGRQA